MKNKECNYVQDLLPNYIENLTASDTNHFIEEHLNTCSDCSKVLENMKKELPEHKIKNDKKQINYLKKFNTKMFMVKLICLIIFVIFFIFAAVTLRKANAITMFAKIASEKLSSQNYHMETYEAYGLDAFNSHCSGNLIITDCYHLDNSFYTTASNYSYISDEVNFKKTSVTHSYFSPNDTSIFLLDGLKGNSKYAYIGDKATNSLTFSYNTSPIAFGSTNFFENIFTAMSYNLSIDSLDLGRACYVFQNNDEAIYVEIRTGLVVRSINKLSHISRNYYYDFDTITQNDIVKPDTTDFIVFD